LKKGSWAQDRAKPLRKRGLKVQSPTGATGVIVESKKKRHVDVSKNMFLMTRQAIPRTWRTLRKGVTGIPLNAPITRTTEDGTTPKPGVPVSSFLIAMFLLII